MSKSFDVCIRGDGLVGRTLALLLARDRLRVALVSRSAVPNPMPDSVPDNSGHFDVRAYALNRASRNLMESLRIWPEAKFATPVLEMQVRGDSGGQLGFSAQSVGQDALAWITDVPALEQQLTQAVKYQPQIEIVAGLDSPVKAALTVVCEGRSSSSRDEFGVQWTVKPYGQRAIAARLQSDKPHAGVARQWFSGSDILALLPLGGTEGNSFAVVWSVSVQRADELEKLSPEDFTSALQNLCGTEAGHLNLISERVAWPLALATANHWVGTGWALAGDAAHTVHPLAGQGLNLGLADVASLASVIAGREYWRSLGDEKLLRRYERARKGDVAAMGAVTDSLNGLFAQTDGRWQALRNWGMNGFAKSGPLKNWIARQATGR